VYINNNYYNKITRRLIYISHVIDGYYIVHRMVILIGNYPFIFKMKMKK